MRRKNLSSSLTIYLLVSEIVLAVLIIVIGYRFARESAYRNLAYKVKNELSILIEPISYKVLQTTELIDLLSKQQRAFQNQDELIHQLELVMELNPDIISVGFYPLFSVQEDNILMLRDFDEYNIFKNIKVIHNPGIEASLINNQSTGWTSIFQDSESSHQIISYSQNISYWSDNEEKKAKVICKISLNPAIHTFQNIKLNKSGFPVIVSNSGFILYHPDTELIGHSIDSVGVRINNQNFNVRDVVKNKRSDTKIIFPACMGHKKSVVVYWPVESIDSTILAIIPESEFLAGLNHILVLIIIGILIIGGLNVAITIYFLVRLVSPVDELVSGSQKYFHDVGLGWSPKKNEIDILAEGIEIMKHRLEKFQSDSSSKMKDSAEIEKELNLAREIEMGMVPTHFPLYPQRNDFECYGKLIPAKIVGGDLFDLFLVDENHLFISICDTLGKGIPAAMFSVVTRTLIRSVANSITRMGKIMEQLNEELSLEGKSDMFVTVFLARLNLKTGELVYCNAGHQHPLIARNDKSVEELLDSHGIPVGVRKKNQFRESSIVLNPGDSLVAFTDGIVEELDEIGEFFGNQRLISVIRNNTHETPEILVNEILRSVETFRSKAEITDDTTLLSVKYWGSEDEETAS